jgi:hypothetical protein
MSSSIINQNILQSCISNRLTCHFYIDLSVGLSRTIDFTKAEQGGLDFQPDFCYVKYFGFQSDHQTAHNPLAIITCDFIRENDLLCPFHPDKSIMSFHNLKYTCKQYFDFRNAKIQVRYIDGNQEVNEDSLDKGNLLVGIEFVRHLRTNERVIW